MLDPGSIKPLYVQLLELLEKEIVSGEREPGEQLPSENELAKQFGVSLITVRKAIGVLCERQLVERKQGKGTFVKGVKYTRDSWNLIGFGESCRSQGVVPGGRMLANQRITLTGSTARNLGQQPGAPGIYISRLRYADGVPVVIEKNYFPEQYSFLLDETFDDNSLFQCLKDRAQVVVSRADKRIELCYANEEEAELLQVNKGTPMLYTKSVAFTQTGEPLYVGIQLMHGERFSLKITQYTQPMSSV